MSLSKILYPLFSYGSKHEDPARHDRKTIDWDLKNQIKPKNLCRFVSAHNISLD